MPTLSPYERLKLWRANNKKKVYAQSRRYYLAHHDKILNYQREYIKKKRAGEGHTTPTEEVSL